MNRVAFILAALEWDLRLTSLVLVAALLVAAVIVALTSRWRKRINADNLSASDQLAEFRSLYEEGAISKEEFERLRAVLGGEIRRELDVPAAKHSPPAPEAVRPEGSPAASPNQEKPPEPPPNGMRPEDQKP